MGVGKSVMIGKVVYTVNIDENTLKLSKTVYPLPGYGNRYGAIIRFIWITARDMQRLGSMDKCNGWSGTDSGLVSENYMKKGEDKIRKTIRKFDEEQMLFLCQDSTAI